MTRAADSEDDRQTRQLHTSVGDEIWPCFVISDIAANLSQSGNDPSGPSRDEKKVSRQQQLTVTRQHRDAKLRSLSASQDRFTKMEPSPENDNVVWNDKKLAGSEQTAL